MSHASVDPRLPDRQREFAAAILDPRRPVPPGCVAPDRRLDAKRLGVYRNNVAASLIEALTQSFPAVLRIVGEEYFRAVARVYVAQDPPASPVMLEYGAGFPSFLRQLGTLSSLPYLPDVARIERAWLESHHAADAISLDPASLARLPEVHAGDACFALHPSLRIVRSSYPALTIWRMNVGDGVPGPVDLSSGEDALVLRREADVEVRAIPAGGAQFLEALAQGQSLEGAAEAGMRACPEFDLTAHLTALLDAGAFVGYRLHCDEA